jgi:hypothetical protein
VVGSEFGMAGLFLLSIASPFLYQTTLEYYDTLTSRPPLLHDFQGISQTEFETIHQDLLREGNEDLDGSLESGNGSGGMTRTSSEFSLGLSRSSSLNDIGKTNYNSLGLCSTGRITYELIKYCGSALIVMGVVWQVSELTKPKSRV